MATAPLKACNSNYPGGPKEDKKRIRRLGKETSPYQN